MQLVRSAQQWSFDSDLPVFSCTKIVFESGGDYFICQSEERQPELDTESINTLAPQKILREQIWPLLEESPPSVTSLPILTSLSSDLVLLHTIALPLLPVCSCKKLVYAKFCCKTLIQTLPDILDVMCRTVELQVFAFNDMLRRLKREKEAVVILTRRSSLT
jgi:hypothetical protein